MNTLARIVLVLLACLPAAVRASGFIDYLVHDDVYDEKLANNRIRYGLDLGTTAPFPVTYERDIAGKVSGDVIVGGGWIHGFFASVQAIVRFRRDKRFRPLIYAGPLYAAGASEEANLCSCDAAGPYADLDPPYYGKARRITHPTLFATAGAGLQIRIWRGLGAEYRIGRFTKLLGRDADIKSAPELEASARDFFRDPLASVSSLVFYEF